MSVSSSGHFFSPVLFDDLGFDFVPYTPIGAYGQSKSATALLAVGISASGLATGFGFIALMLASVNIFGGFLVTQRMLAMYKKKEK